MSKSANSKSAREKARQARLAAEAAHRRRERTIRIVGGGAVVLIVAAIIVAAVLSSRKDTAGDGLNPSAALPNGVNAETYAYQVIKDPAGGIPTVQIWEDFQCPACKSFEDSVGSALYAAAAKGEVNLQLRPTTFLDAKLPQSKKTSARATSAWGCAIDAGKPLEYHKAVFVNQPTEEGTEVPQDKLIEFGRQVGITGGSFDSFSSCVREDRYLGWAANSTSIFEKDSIAGTPTVFVNGKELPLKGITAPEQLMEKIKSMAAA